MISRIELKNFMSHAHTVIEPAQGLTVLVGENNSGKSAIINALQVLCKNISGDYMVRHGEKECLIRVDSSEGNTLVWRRKGKTVSYNINGRDVHRLGGSVPDDLHELLRLPNVESENDSFDIHFGEQKDPIFLLNSTPSKRATFFASSSDTIKLIEMQTQHKNKVKDAKKRESALAHEEEVYKKRLETLAPVEDIGKRLEHLEAEYENINRALEQIGLLEQRIGGLEKARHNHLVYNQTVLAVQDLVPPPELEDTQQISRLINNIIHQYAQIDKSRAIAGVAEKLDAPPVLEDTAPLGRLVRDLSKQEGKSSYWHLKSHLISGLESPPELFASRELANHISKLETLSREAELENQRVGVLDSCTDPPALHDPMELQELITRMQRAYSHQDYLRSADSCLFDLHHPPEMQDTSSVQDLIKRIEQAGRECEKRRNDLQNAEKDFKQAEEKLREHISNTEICPTCGQKMDPEHILNLNVVE